VRAVFSFGDFVLARDIAVPAYHPPSTWRMALLEKMGMHQRIDEATHMKYLEFDLVEVGREVAFYEFSRIVG